MSEILSPLLTNLLNVGFLFNACGWHKNSTQRLCFVDTDATTGKLSTLTFIVLEADSKVSGENYGSLSKPEESYYADYWQKFSGKLKNDRLVLNVSTQLRASRDDIQGYPTQTQEIWSFNSQKVTPLIHRIALQRADCELLDASLQKSNQWLRAEPRAK